MATTRKSDCDFGDLGLLTNEEKAKEWYQKAAEGADNGAQRRLGEACE